MKAKMKSKRTFGVEIEFKSNHYNIDEIAQLLQEQTRLFVYAESYNHETRPHWKIITDSTCGYELVSPILKGQEGLKEMQKIVDALDGIEGTDVNKRCGIHVHVHMENYDAYQIGNVLKYYAKYEKEIDMVMPVSRRTSTPLDGRAWRSEYCIGLAERHGMNNSTPRGKRESFHNKITRIQREWKKGNISSHRCINKYLDLLGSFPDNRYCTVNLNSYARYGTIEFRQHGGSLNSTKIAMWVCFCTNLIDRSIKTKFVQVSKDACNLKNFANIFGEQQSRAILRFFEDRAVNTFGYGYIRGAYNHATAMRRV